MVATLAEKFSITRFKDYQRQIISAILKGQDCLVIQPTGSGKSMCFQFPPVFENKKSSHHNSHYQSYQDHVTNAERLGLKAVFL